MQARRFLWFAAIAITVRITGQTPDGASYVGSPACKTCHQATWARWSRTRMANVLTDPKLRPEVILPDFKKPDPLRTFGIDDIAFV